MAGLIEDYAIIGDTRTVALVERGGSIDWFCAPRIDSSACFASLLGEPKHGRWLMAPAAEAQTTRRYEKETLVLETIHETADGTVAVIDFMPPEHPHPTIHRMVECRSGKVEMNMELEARFDYGSIVPWVESTGDGLSMVAGPDGLRFHSPVPLRGVDRTTVASFEIGEGEPQNVLADVVRRRHRRAISHGQPGRTDGHPPLVDGLGGALHLRRRLARRRGAIPHHPQGAHLRPDRAPCAPRRPRRFRRASVGCANWDYRFSWLRDATMTLQAFLLSGYVEEAAAWAQWLRRAVAGDPGEFQIMYGVLGKRRLTELELDWLPGYEGSKPVRIGNEASNQFQLDVFGEMMDAVLVAAHGGVRRTGSFNGVGLALLDELETVWSQPDDGIWEVRGPRRHFTHSKVMAWVAFDRAIHLVDEGLLTSDDSDHWRELRDTIHAEVCEKGWNDEVGAFTQYYGATTLDASLLMMATVGFLPADDERIVATVDAIQRELVVDGFVKRYQTGPDNADGLPGHEGAFLLTTFWLADNLALMGRTEEASSLFERLRGLRNDVGLLSEEYDPDAKRMLGNFPQAFSHIGLIHTAANLSLEDASPCAIRSTGSRSSDPSRS